MSVGGARDSRCLDMISPGFQKRVDVHTFVKPIVQFAVKLSLFYKLLLPKHGPNIPSLLQVSQSHVQSRQKTKAEILCP